MNTAQGGTPRILLVEDEALVALTEKETIEKRDFEVLTVHSGEEAVRTSLDDSGIALVLMDIDLGKGMDGVEAAQRILAQRHLPIVFLSAHTESEYVDRLQEITGYGYVLKGAGEFVLLQSIEMALRLFRAQQETRELERKYRLMADNCTDALTTADMEFNPTYVSPSITELLGYTQEEYLALTAQDILTPDSYHRAVAAYRARRSEDTSTHRLELEHVRKDGSTVWCESLTRPMFDEQGKHIGTIVSTRDISERKRRETQLRRRERDFVSLVENASDMIVRFDTDFRVLYCNKAVERHVGRAQESFLGKTSLEAGTPKPQARFIEQTLREALRSGEEQHVQQKFPTPSGVKWFDTRVVPECNEAGEIESFLAITRDVTERAQAEEARKRSEQRFRALVENTPDLIFEIDADGTFTYLSPSSHTVKGFPPEALQGTHIRDRVHPDDDAHAEETLRRLLMEQQPDGAQVRVLHGDGNWRMHWTRLTPLFDASGTLTGAIGIARDVTQKKQTEEALRQSEEQARRLLEEKELLLREVHHRIKNDMAMIEGLLMLQAQSVESAEATTALEEARRRIAVMKNAYRQLYEGGDIQRVDLQTFAGTLISEIERSHGAHRAIEVSRDIEAVMIPSRSAFPLGIIVNELLTNAYKYAFPGERSGSIHVRIEREEARRESRQESEPKQGARLRLTVTDDGIGIPEDAATAESSSGIQLVQSLAEQHHGTFTLHHDGGTVAEVELKLPEA